MAIRGVRGATTADQNTKDEILSKTEELLLKIIKENNIDIEDIASVFFSMTDDLTAEFPAVAARNMGWTYTPLFCQKELTIDSGLGKCIRVLLHVNSSKSQKEMLHQYLRGAKVLRPDFSKE